VLAVGGYGCPSFAVTLGRASATKKITLMKDNSTRTQTDWSFDIDMTSIMCFQHVETVSTNVTLRLPASSLGVISPETAPVTDESTARYLINRLSNYTGRIFEFPLNSLLFSLSYGTGNITTLASADNNSEMDVVEKPGTITSFAYFLASVNSSLPISKLVGRASTQNLVDATNRIYKQYMPQAISNNMRSADLANAEVSTPDSPAAKITPLTFTTQARGAGCLRLKQGSAPKLAIQIILGVMIVCIVMSRVLLRGIEKVVPHNPCSIAGRASLFADGVVSTRRLVPYGAEWLKYGRL
jgi:hypothetical protein